MSAEMLDAVMRAIWDAGFCADATYDEAVAAAKRGSVADANALLFNQEVAKAAISAMQSEIKKARAGGMREAAEIAAHRYAVCEDAFSKGIGAEERHCALEAKHIEDKIRARAGEIEQEARNG